ncbi:hypothetical protein MNV49_003423 [Pseudohyphozyma bogoriensis]|nr:hypothetical protein MNV49_003423 [Pseudohyphozyma bogoriensis]
MSAPALPHELYIQILRDDAISESDLTRCCLVSRLFRAIATPLLYEKVTLNLRGNLDQEKPQNNMCRKSSLLCQRLTTSSELGHLTRSLELNFSRCGTLEDIRAAGDPTPFITLLLRMFPSVQHIELKEVTRGDFSWLANTFEQVRPRLRSLKLLLDDYEAGTLKNHVCRLLYTLPDLKSLGTLPFTVDSPIRHAPFGLMRLNLNEGVWPLAFDFLTSIKEICEERGIELELLG